WARPEFLDYTNPDHVGSRYDSHQNSYADACAMLRVADLESGARYQPEVHDAFFRNFTWRNLNDEEADLAPPCVVHMRPGSQRGARMGELIELFSGGRPLKVFVLQEHAVFGTAATGRAAINQLHPDFGFMGIALRRVFVVQGVPGEADLTADILTGLQSHRPAIFSLLETDPGANPHLGSAHLAIASRAFPRFVYNPDAGIALADCLDISENPDPDSQWARIDGRTITYADFAARDLRMHSEFTPFQTEVAHGVAMNNPMDVQAYLELPAIERRKHTPVVILTNADGNSTRLVPSRSIIEQTMDRAQLWLNLQSMAGKGTPHAVGADADPSVATGAEPTTSANKELQQQREEIEQQAVTRAITNLVARLALGN
ncbi:MAG: hypothetical protein KDK27_20110, partial [Leptospiraceae bacterium]|nr:hypothetical protein [Leptospiraceae bacterium]